MSIIYDIGKKIYVNSPEENSSAQYNKGQTFQGASLRNIPAYTARQKC